MSSSRPDVGCFFCRNPGFSILAGCLLTVAIMFSATMVVATYSITMEPAHGCQTGSLVILFEWDGLDLTGSWPPELGLATPDSLGELVRWQQESQYGISTEGPVYARRLVPIALEDAPALRARILEAAGAPVERGYQYRVSIDDGGSLIVFSCDRRDIVALLGSYSGGGLNGP